MKDTFDRVSEFMKSVAHETPMESGEGAVIILALTRQGCEEGQSRTCAMVQGTCGDLEELLFYTLVSDKKMRSVILEAMKSHLIKSVIPENILEEMAKKAESACDKPTAADPSEVQPTTTDSDAPNTPDTPDTDAHTTGTEAKA